MKRVLVLGGTGFLGAHLCEKLVRAGWYVTVATRHSSHARGLLHLPSTQIRELNMLDYGVLTRAVAGFDAVVNLVGILHGSAAQFRKVHAELPQNLAATRYLAGVGRMVHVSALGANPKSPDAAPSQYLRSKSMGEAILQAGGEGLALTILRPSVIFGAGDQFLNRFASLQKHLPLVPLACANARFQPVWVEDVAQAIVNSLERQSPGVRVLEACGPDVYTLRQLVRLAGQLAGINHGRGRPILALPQWAGRLQARLLELLPGEPVLSRDNLDSMRLPNVATPDMPGLEQLGIHAAALEPVARDYLRPVSPEYTLMGTRRR